MYIQISPWYGSIIPLYQKFKRRNSFKYACHYCYCCVAQYQNTCTSQLHFMLLKHIDPQISSYSVLQKNIIDTYNSTCFEIWNSIMCYIFCYVWSDKGIIKIPIWFKNHVWNVILWKIRQNGIQPFQI